MAVHTEAILSPREDVTALLGEWREGDRAAFDRLLPAVYRELRRLAARSMAGERADHTLEPTALVHEAYLRLARPGSHSAPAWRDRLHFYAVAARMMRRILVDHARARVTGKRGGGAPHVELEEARSPSPERSLDDLIALDRALDRLAVLDPRKARVIELRHFAGLTVAEVAELLGISHPTVILDTRTARAWLLAEMRAPAPGGGGA